eukprot:3668469-Amphidinium_carterae.1
MSGWSVLQLYVGLQCSGSQPELVLHGYENNCKCLKRNPAACNTQNIKQTCLLQLFNEVGERAKVLKCGDLLTTLIAAFRVACTLTYLQSTDTNRWGKQGCCVCGSVVVSENAVSALFHFCDAVKAIHPPFQQRCMGHLLPQRHMESLRA